MTSRHLMLAIAGALCISSGTAEAGSSAGAVALHAALTPGCSASTSGNGNVSYDAFAADSGFPTLLSQTLVLSCTRNIHIIRTQWDTANGTNQPITQFQTASTGMVAGLVYQLTTGIPVFVPGVSAYANNAATATTYTWNAMSVYLPGGQAGDVTAPSSVTRTLTITY